MKKGVGKLVFLAFLAVLCVVFLSKGIYSSCPGGPGDLYSTYCSDSKTVARCSSDYRLNWPAYSSCNSESLSCSSDRTKLITDRYDVSCKDDFMTDWLYIPDNDCTYAVGSQRRSKCFWNEVKVNVAGCSGEYSSPSSHSEKKCASGQACCDSAGSTGKPGCAPIEKHCTGSDKIEVSACGGYLYTIGCKEDEKCVQVSSKNAECRNSKKVCAPSQVLCPGDVCKSIQPTKCDGVDIVKIDSCTGKKENVGICPAEGGVVCCDSATGASCKENKESSTCGGSDGKSKITTDACGTETTEVCSGSCTMITDGKAECSSETRKKEDEIKKGKKCGDDNVPADIASGDYKAKLGFCSPYGGCPPGEYCDFLTGDNICGCRERKACASAGVGNTPLFSGTSEDKQLFCSQNLCDSGATCEYDSSTNTCSCKAEELCQGLAGSDLACIDKKCNNGGTCQYQSALVPGGYPTCACSQPKCESGKVYCGDNSDGSARCEDEKPRKCKADQRTLEVYSTCSDDITKIDCPTVEGAGFKCCPEDNECKKKESCSKVITEDKLCKNQILSARDVVFHTEKETCSAGECDPGFTCDVIYKDGKATKCGCVAKGKEDTVTTNEECSDIKNPSACSLGHCDTGSQICNITYDKLKNPVGCACVDKEENETTTRKKPTEEFCYFLPVPNVGVTRGPVNYKSLAPRGKEFPVSIYFGADPEIYSKREVIQYTNPEFYGDVSPQVFAYREVAEGDDLLCQVDIELNEECNLVTEPELKLPAKPTQPPAKAPGTNPPAAKSPCPETQVLCPNGMCKDKKPGICSGATILYEDPCTGKLGNFWSCIPKQQTCCVVKGEGKCTDITPGGPWTCSDDKRMLLNEDSCGVLISAVKCADGETCELGGPNGADCVGGAAGAPKKRSGTSSSLDSLTETENLDEGIALANFYLKENLDLAAGEIPVITKNARGEESETGLYLDSLFIYNLNREEVGTLEATEGVTGGYNLIFDDSLKGKIPILPLSSAESLSAGLNLFDILNNKIVGLGNKGIYSSFNGNQEEVIYGESSVNYLAETENLDEGLALVNFRLDKNFGISSAEKIMINERGELVETGLSISNNIISTSNGEDVGRLLSIKEIKGGYSIRFDESSKDKFPIYPLNFLSDKPVESELKISLYDVLNGKILVEKRDRVYSAFALDEIATGFSVSGMVVEGGNAAGTTGTTASASAGAYAMAQAAGAISESSGEVVIAVFQTVLKKTAAQQDAETAAQAAKTAAEKCKPNQVKCADGSCKDELPSTCDSEKIAKTDVCTGKVTFVKDCANEAGTKCCVFDEGATCMGGGELTECSADNKRVITKDACGTEISSKARDCKNGCKVITSGEADCISDEEKAASEKEKEPPRQTIGQYLSAVASTQRGNMLSNIRLGGTFNSGGKVDILSTFPEGNEGEIGLSIKGSSIYSGKDKVGSIVPVRGMPGNYKLDFLPDKKSKVSSALYIPDSGAPVSGGEISYYDILNGKVVRDGSGGIYSSYSSSKGVTGAVIQETAGITGAVVGASKGITGAVIAAETSSASAAASASAGASATTGQTSDKTGVLNSGVVTCKEITDDKKLSADFKIKKYYRCTWVDKKSTIGNRGKDLGCKANIMAIKNKEVKASTSVESDDIAVANYNFFYVRSGAAPPWKNGVKMTNRFYSISELNKYGVFTTPENMGKNIYLEKSFTLAPGDYKGGGNVLSSEYQSKITELIKNKGYKFSPEKDTVVFVSPEVVSQYAKSDFGFYSKGTPFVVTKSFGEDILQSEIISYDLGRRVGPLCGRNDGLVPLFKDLQSLGCQPKSPQVYCCGVAGEAEDFISAEKEKKENEFLAKLQRGEITEGEWEAFKAEHGGTKDTHDYLERRGKLTAETKARLDMEYTAENGDLGSEDRNRDRSILAGQRSDLLTRLDYATQTKDQKAIDEVNALLKINSLEQEKLVVEALKSRGNEIRGLAGFKNGDVISAELDVKRGGSFSGFDGKGEKKKVTIEIKIDDNLAYRPITVVVRDEYGNVINPPVRAIGSGEILDGLYIKMGPNSYPVYPEMFNDISYEKYAKDSTDEDQAQGATSYEEIASYMYSQQVKNAKNENVIISDRAANVDERLRLANKEKELLDGAKLSAYDLDSMLRAGVSSNRVYETAAKDLLLGNTISNSLIRSSGGSALTGAVTMGPISAEAGRVDLMVRAASGLSAEEFNKIQEGLNSKAAELEAKLDTIKNTDASEYGSGVNKNIALAEVQTEQKELNTLINRLNQVAVAKNRAGEVKEFADLKEQNNDAGVEKKFFDSLITPFNSDLAAISDAQEALYSKENVEGSKQAIANSYEAAKNRLETIRQASPHLTEETLANYYNTVVKEMRDKDITNAPFESNLLMTEMLTSLAGEYDSRVWKNMKSEIDKKRSDMRAAGKSNDEINTEINKLITNNEAFKQISKDFGGAAQGKLRETLMSEDSKEVDRFTKDKDYFRQLEVAGRAEKLNADIPDLQVKRQDLAKQLEDVKSRRFMSIPEKQRAIENLQQQIDDTDYEISRAMTLLSVYGVQTNEIVNNPNAEPKLRAQLLAVSINSELRGHLARSADYVKYGSVWNIGIVKWTKSVSGRLSSEAEILGEESDMASSLILALNDYSVNGAKLTEKNKATLRAWGVLDRNNQFAGPPGRSVFENSVKTFQKNVIDDFINAGMARDIAIVIYSGGTMAPGTQLGNFLLRAGRVTKVLTEAAVFTGVGTGVRYTTDVMGAVIVYGVESATARRLIDLDSTWYAENIADPFVNAIKNVPKEFVYNVGLFGVTGTVKNVLEARGTPRLLTFLAEQGAFVGYGTGVEVVTAYAKGETIDINDVLVNQAVSAAIFVGGMHIGQKLQVGESRGIIERFESERANSVNQAYRNSVNRLTKQNSDLLTTLKKLNPNEYRNKRESDIPIDETALAERTKQFEDSGMETARAKLVARKMLTAESMEKIASAYNAAEKPSQKRVKERTQLSNAIKGLNDLNGYINGLRKLAEERANADTVEKANEIEQRTVKEMEKLLPGAIEKGYISKGEADFMILKMRINAKMLDYEARFKKAIDAKKDEEALGIQEEFVAYLKQNRKQFGELGGEIGRIRTEELRLTRLLVKVKKSGKGMSEAEAAEATDVGNRKSQMGKRDAENMWTRGLALPERIPTKADEFKAKAYEYAENLKEQFDSLERKLLDEKAKNDPKTTEELDRFNEAQKKLKEYIEDNVEQFSPEHKAAADKVKAARKKLAEATTEAERKSLGDELFRAEYDLWNGVGDKKGLRDVVKENMGDVLKAAESRPQAKADFREAINGMIAEFEQLERERAADNEKLAAAEEAKRVMDEQLKAAEAAKDAAREAKIKAERDKVIADAEKVERQAADTNAKRPSALARRNTAIDDALKRGTEKDAISKEDAAAISEVLRREGESGAERAPAREGTPVQERTPEQARTNVEVADVLRGTPITGENGIEAGWNDGYGRITIDAQKAKDAFPTVAESLREKFSKQGLTGSELERAVSNGVLEFVYNHELSHAYTQSEAHASALARTAMGVDTPADRALLANSPQEIVELARKQAANPGSTIFFDGIREGLREMKREALRNGEVAEAVFFDGVDRNLDRVQVGASDGTTSSEMANRGTNEAKSAISRAVLEKAQMYDKINIDGVDYQVYRKFKNGNLVLRKLNSDGTLDPAEKVVNPKDEPQNIQSSDTKVDKSIRNMLGTEIPREVMDIVDRAFAGEPVGKEEIRSVQVRLTREYEITNQMASSGEAGAPVVDLGKSAKTSGETVGSAAKQMADSTKALAEALKEKYGTDGIDSTTKKESYINPETGKRESAELSPLGEYSLPSDEQRAMAQAEAETISGESKLNPSIEIPSSAKPLEGSYGRAYVAWTKEGRVTFEEPKESGWEKVMIKTARLDNLQESLTGSSRDRAGNIISAGKRYDKNPEAALEHAKRDRQERVDAEGKMRGELEAREKAAGLPDGEVTSGFVKAKNTGEVAITDFIEGTDLEHLVKSEGVYNKETGRWTQNYELVKPDGMSESAWREFKRLLDPAWEKFKSQVDKAHELGWAHGDLHAGNIRVQFSMDANGNLKPNAKTGSKVDFVAIDLGNAQVRGSNLYEAAKEVDSSGNAMKSMDAHDVRIKGAERAASTGTTIIKAFLVYIKAINLAPVLNHRAILE